MSDIAASLDKAADLMAEKPWYRCGKPGPGAVGHASICVAVAIEQAAGPDATEVADAFRRHIGLKPTHIRDYWDLFEWNDQVAKSKKAVIKALRGAAEAERERI